MADRTMKQGDTWPPLPIQPRQSNGSPVDLTGAEEILPLIRSDSHVIQCAAENVEVDGDATEGNAYYNWQSGDTDYPGMYNIEYRITDSQGNIRTYPTRDYRTLEIVPNLAAT